MLFLAAMLALVAASCVRQSIETGEWPADLPPVDYYERIYDQDDANSRVQTRKDYLKWVVRFYKGWELYQDGWHDISRDVLLSVDDAADKPRVEAKLAALGKRISGEWAKSTRERAIRSRELSIWGQALVKAMDLGEEEKLINQVSRDVEALLEQTLRPADITLKRYYEPESRARDS